MYFLKYTVLVTLHQMCLGRGNGLVSEVKSVGVCTRRKIRLLVTKEEEGWCQDIIITRVWTWVDTIIQSI